MTYEEWQAWVPAAVRASSRWKKPAYRLALFLTELAWADVRMLMRHRRARLAGRLYAALCDVSDNLALICARGPFDARTDLYASALQSARIGQDCYAQARQELGARAVRHRLRLLAHIIRLLPETASLKTGSRSGEECVFCAIWQIRQMLPGQARRQQRT